MEPSSSYRATLRGRVSERLASAFAGVRVEPGDGITVLIGELKDQAALYGLLNKRRGGEHGRGSEPAEDRDHRRPVAIGAKT